MSLRVAIVVGVVVAVLFVAVLAFGGGDGQGSASEETEQEGGLLGRLRARVGDPSLVGVDDVTSDCAGPARGLLLFNSCTVTVRNPGRPAKTPARRLSTPAPNAVRTPNPVT